MEALLGLTLFGSVLWFWISVAVFIIICFLSDVNENGFWAFATLVVLGVAYYFRGHVDPLLQVLTLQNILIYLGIGLGFSFLRTFFAGRKLGHEIKDLPKTREDIKAQSHVYDTQKDRRERFLEELKGNIFRWWFMWPVSLITWAVTDIVKDIYDYVYSKMSGLYNWIVDLGMKSI